MLLDLLTNHEKKKKMLFETYPTNIHDQVVSTI